MVLLVHSLANVFVIAPSKNNNFSKLLLVTLKVNTIFGLSRMGSCYCDLSPFCNNHLVVGAAKHKTYDKVTPLWLRLSAHFNMLIPVNASLELLLDSRLSKLCL